MIFNKKTYNFLLSTIATLFLVSAVSCSDNENAPEYKIEPDEFQLLFSLSSAIGSRADTDLTDNDENFIGQPTFSLYYKDSFFMDLSDKVEPLTEKNKYRATIKFSDFETAFSDINVIYSEELLQQKDFRIMVTANWKSYDINSKTSFTGSLTDLWSNSSDYNFNYKTGNNNSAWIPNSTEKNGIPMFGLSDPCIVYEQKEEIQIPTLRALAKIEVYDVTKVKGISPFSIHSVTLSKSAGSGRLIPDITKNVDWNVENKQVVSPSIPSGYQTSVTNLILFKTSENLTYKDIDGNYDKWVCYIPEMDISKEEFKDAILDIKLNDTEIHAVVSLKDAINKSLNSNYILRNNSYQFFLTVLKETTNTFTVEIDPDPFGDINFISVNGNKYWLHNENVGETDVEVWYKLVYHDEDIEDIRSHWEKEWYFGKDGYWYKWNGSNWIREDISSQGPYDKDTHGINTNIVFNEIINKFLEQTDYNVAGEVAANYFKEYGKTLEMDGKPVKCFMLNKNVTVEASYHVLPIHKDYILYGNGNTVYLEIYGGPTRYNIGPVRDIYIERPGNVADKYRIYIDKEGNVINENGRTLGTLTPLTGNNRSYNINFDGNNIGVVPDPHFNSFLNK